MIILYALTSMITVSLFFVIIGGAIKARLRVYIKDTCILSANLNPVPSWNIDAQICALNWQTLNAHMQINKELVSRSDRYVSRARCKCWRGRRSQHRQDKEVDSWMDRRSFLLWPQSRRYQAMCKYSARSTTEDLQGKTSKRKTEAHT